MNKELLDKLAVITEEEQKLLDGKELDRGIYMSPESMEIDARQLLDDGKLITVRPHTRFVNFPPHTHNYVELVYMCKGETIHRLNGIEVRIKEGELLFLNPNTVQEINAAGKDDIAVNFIILPEFFDTTLKMTGGEENQLRDFLISVLKSSKSGVGYLHFKVSDVLPVQNLVENLIWTLVNRQVNKRSINQYTMGVLFLQLMNYTDKVDMGSDMSEQKVMLSVLKYIEEHYREGELTQLAEMMHYDLSWLSRLIKKQTGKTFTELMQVKRINQAAFLLKTTNLTVADVCQRIGYENISYFHRLFNKTFGMTPKKYRDN